MALYFRAGLNQSDPHYDQTVAGALDRLDPILDGLRVKYSMLNRDYADRAESVLSDMRDNEEQFFQLFRDVHSVEDLQTRLTEIRTTSSTWQKLSGPYLYSQVIVPALAASGDYRAVIEAEFQNWMTENLTRDRILERCLQTDDMGLAVGQLINEALNEAMDEAQLGSSRAHVWSTQAARRAVARSGGRQFNLATISMRDFTRAQKRLIRQVMENRIAARAMIQQTAADNQSTTIDTTIPMKDVGDWYSVTKGLTQLGAIRREMLDKTFSQMAIKDKLLDYLRALGFDSEIITVADEVFSTYIQRSTGEALPFFLGNNIEKGITGILGEIQGLYIVRKLLAPQYANITDVSWIGGIDNPHEDLIVTLKEIGKKWGIQVKNTNEDALSDSFEKEINFASRTINTFYDFTDIAAEDQEALNEIYQMDAFNVEYQRTYQAEEGAPALEEGEFRFIAAPNDDFHPIRERIDDFKHIADGIFSIFSDTLMYMACAKSGKGFGSIGNTIYLIGGARLYAASQLYAKILEQIKSGQRNFEITPTFSGGDPSVHNIADYFNLYGRPINSDGRLRYSKVGRSQAMGDLVLTTSYLFQ